MNSIKRIVTISILLINSLIYSQTSESKSCGSCFAKVSIYSKVGDICPHCGVKWGYENSSTISVNSDYKTSNNSKKYSEKRASGFPGNEIVKKNYDFRYMKDENNATKQETEKWILEKINSCVDNNEHFRYRYSFDKYHLVVSYLDSNDPNFKVYIPIYYLKNLVESGVIENAITLYTETEKIVRKGKNSKYIGSWEHISFKSGCEINLQERLAKAFLHLKKFYKKPIKTSNEPF